MKKLKRQVKGITLIVLVVTIIVLLILAGIVISLTVGNNGIFKRADNSVDEYNKSKAREKIEFAILEYKIDINNGNLYEILNQIEGVEEVRSENGDDKLPYVVIVDDYEFVIDKNLTIEYTGKKYGIKPEIISINKNDTIIEIKAKTEDEQGIREIRIIRNGEQIDKIENLKGKEIQQQYEVKLNGEYKIIVIGGNERRAISEKMRMIVTQSAPTVTVIGGNKLENEWYTSNVNIRIEPVVEEGQEATGIITKYKINGQQEKSLQGSKEDILIEEDGIYEIIAYSISSDGKRSEETKVVIKKDTVAPNDFTPSQESMDVTKKQIGIKAKAEDLSEIKEYRYYLNGELITTTSNETYTITNLERGTEYELYVIAVDNVGKEKKSTSISIALQKYLYKNGEKYTDLTRWI